MLLVIPNSFAQDIPFQNGEELHFDIHYKYGVVVMKGGTARYCLNITNYNRKQTLKSSLDFKTTSFFDKIYKIRDTLNSYATIPDLKPIYNYRNVNEGNTHFIEELFVQKHGDSYSEVRIKRTREGEVRMDTILSANNLGYDFLNVFLFVQDLDYSKVSPGNTYNLTAFFGKKKINIIIRYRGQAILEKSETLKYKALRLTIDIVDEAFTESQNAMEVWVSDDENHIPLKLKAKLKIGAAEADLSSYKNLKYPLTSEIKIKVKQ
jgi:hypothetical protein